ncbi:MAG: metallophosphoesterase [Defluviitaleaceae bacterium]|nr:metallophosphoesterase [Defluviitaleaceae bacterium]
MQILVLSDSHGKIDSIPNLLKQYKNKVQTVVHLGDNARDLLQFQPEYSEMNLVAIAGNCDFSAVAPRERILTLGTKRILLTHGHSHNVKSSYHRLMYYSLEKEADVCLFGHTHIHTVFDHESVFFMNPGSLGEPRGLKPSYGLVTIDNAGNVTGEVINI